SDWRVGLGLISAFAAREVFVSSLAVVMNASEDVDEETGLQTSLLEKMRQASWPDGSPLFTLASIAALIVFFMIALQCMSTVGVSWRETGSWKFALTQLVAMNVVAYILSVVVYQMLS